MIKELQTSMTIMQETLNKHAMHIKSLEDAVIALSDSEDDAKEYEKAKKIATNIKRKRKARSEQNSNDSDTSEEVLERRTSLRFRKQKISSAVWLYHIENQNKQNPISSKEESVHRTCANHE